jgi:hypothetical protein
MANDLSINPLYIDTAGSTSAITHPIKIWKIIWDNPTNAAHTLILKDKSGGKTYLKFIAGTTGVSVEIDFPYRLWMPSFYVDTLGSGAIYVYYE